ncbi:Xaa-Pro peptidase family protein [Aquibium sp. A9E412]|uniref:M24 family metallopeptidase n=1 Tax=Aquibium sp. A9E412 TaxID=2976767 RepID=UPI0025B1CDFF|nr:Xaa-Pro peptidase family protein [Aquibium sp. A9E412]MDN2567119.1 Xaa-Pro peptidase family protein [Aquibium sp. A9E412]
MLLNRGRLEGALSEKRLDAVVAATPENVRYLTGVGSVSLKIHPYFGSCFAVLPAGASAAPQLVSSVGESDQILDAFEGVEVAATFGTFHREMRDDGPLALSQAEQRLKAASVDLASSGSPAAALASALSAAGLERAHVGLDRDGLKPGVEDELCGLLPAARFSDASDLLAWTRRVKTAEEVRRLRRAAAATEQAIRAVSAILEEGLTEREMMLEFNRTVAAQGATPQLTMIRIGRNGVGGQVTPDRTPLRKGDTIWFDVACTRDGYWSDIARNVAFGEPDARVAAFYAALKHGEDVAIADARPGMTAGALFDLMVDAVREAGMPHYRRHHVGHGIGTEIYEKPVITPGNDLVLEAGMVLNVETPYYEFGTGGIHVENPFVLGEAGNTLLTTLSRELMVVEP